MKAFNPVSSTTATPSEMTMPMSIRSKGAGMNGSGCLDVDVIMGWGQGLVQDGQVSPGGAKL
jgi:hypothetical protein